MSDQESVFYCRVLTELTLSFHIIYATIGVGIPIMIMIAQWIGIKKQDEHYILLARRWSRGYVVTVAVGVVTGTAIGLQLSLLWPHFMQLVGNVIALPLFLETFAFFFEAIFLGIYLYTWDRFENQQKHFLLLLPVAIGASCSALFITSVNAFMNAPRGFKLFNGQLVRVNPLEAMLNPATPTKVMHVLMSAYMTSAFVLASIGAFRLIQSHGHVYHKKSLFLTLKLGFVFSLATAIIGDFSGKFLAEYQPEKLAAAEWHFTTEKGAPLLMYGVINHGKVKYALKIPDALSFLAHDNFQAQVIGLNEFPEENTPPLYIHYLFDSMVTIGVLLSVLSLVYLIGTIRSWNFTSSKWYRWLIVLSGPLSILAIETGWWLDEVGRQPWILRGFLRTKNAATANGNVDIILWLFIVLYFVLGIGTIIVLKRMFHENTIEKELADRSVGKAGAGV